MMNAAASTWGKPGGSGMHNAAGAMVWVAKPPVPERQATLWPTFSCVTPSPTAAITPAYSDPGTNGSGGFIWYLFCTMSRSGKFRLAALISISTSPALGLGVGISFHCSASTPTGFSQSHACIGSSARKRGDDKAHESGLNVSAATFAPTMVSTLYRDENPAFQRRWLPGTRNRRAP